MPDGLRKKMMYATRFVAALRNAEPPIPAASPKKIAENPPIAAVSVSRIPDCRNDALQKNLMYEHQNIRRGRHPRRAPRHHG
ncbi:hypothetical protein EYW49_03410 [Siculibacillus lacustris]|uniref:Uncharacterized protein n=1 Tax=Siculibacillus lacustris TaxID=1549641 RepID=A0A4Q9VZG7_9HYPH|nr:hypothetical protein [Siculibacillus lacustris]TBW40786.1 hypothetical protein EYW49_03410 [Siculibacillus lacustris]